MSLRIVLLAPFAVHPKGTTRWRVLPLARALGDLGHQVRVVIPPYDWPAHSGQQWRWTGATAVNVALPKAAAGPGHLVLAQRLLHAVRDWEPDVVHVFKPQGYSGLVGQWLLSSREKVPVIVDVDDWEPGWHRRLGYPLHWRWFFANQERLLLRQAPVVTVASRWLGTYVRGQRFPGCRICYLPNGVSSNHPSPAWRSCSNAPQSPEESWSRRRSVLLFTRFVEHTASQVWRIWRHVQRSVPNARLLVAGESSFEQEEFLAGLAGSILLLGWLPVLTRPGLLAAVQAAMLPVEDAPLSRAKAPMRLLDLLAAGVPTAVHGVGEYGHYVRHEETGLVVPPGDDLALADAVVRLLQDPQLGCQLGRAAQRWIDQNYSWRRLVYQALGAYVAAMAA